MSAATLKSYRTTIILDTRGYDQPIENLIERIKGSLGELNVTVSDMENLGRKDFAHTPDIKHTADTYIQCQIEGGKSFPADVQEHFRLDQNVKRVFVENV